MSSWRAGLKKGVVAERECGDCEYIGAKQLEGGVVVGRNCRGLE